MRANNGRIWATSVVDGNKYGVCTITQADLEESLDVLNNSFFIRESVSIGCEIDLPENGQARKELRELCRITANDGISLCVKHLGSGEIVAVSFNKIQYTPAHGEEHFFLKFRNESAKSPQAKCLMDFMIEVDGKIDICALYNMNCFCELMFLATLPTYVGKGFGRMLAKHTIELARELSQGLSLDDIAPELRDKRPAAVAALWTSIFSQRVGKAAGFKVINTVPFTEFTYNGKRFDERINPLHKFCEHVIFTFA